MSNVEKLLSEILKELKAMRDSQEDLRADLAETLALKRKHLSGKSQKYLDFESFVLGRNWTDTPAVVGKFRVSKMTALTWMNHFAYDHSGEGFFVRRGFGQDPSMLLRKKDRGGKSA